MTIDVDRYHDQGFLELGRLVRADDVAQVTELFDRLEASGNVPESYQPQYDEFDGRRRLRKLRRLLWNDPNFFAPILCRAGVPDLARQVIGPEATAVFHAAFLKPADIGTHVGLHQDQALWSRDYPGAFSVWIALTTVSPPNGGLFGRPASHRQGTLPHRDDDQHPWHPTLRHRADALESEHQFELSPGEVVMWDRDFAHGSGANTSRNDRRGMVVVFADGGDPSFNPIDAMTVDMIDERGLAGRTTARG